MLKIAKFFGDFLMFETNNSALDQNKQPPRDKVGKSVLNTHIDIDRALSSSASVNSIQSYSAAQVFCVSLKREFTKVGPQIFERILKYCQNPRGRHHFQKPQE